MNIVDDLAQKGRHPAYCLSLGRGGARPGGCERGGYLSIPRREARAGEWVWPQRPE